MKKITAVLVTLMMVMSLAACGSSGGNSPQTEALQAETEAGQAVTEAPAEEKEEAPANVETKKLLMSVVLSEDSQQGVFAKAFKSKVEELTEGRYDIQITYNEQLSGGDGPKTIEMLQQGAIDLDVHFNQMFISYEPKLGIVVMPFLFKSDEDVDKALDNGLEDYFKSLMRESVGVQVLGYGKAGFMNMASNKKNIETPEDLVNLKMRCPTQLAIDMFTEYGASPVSVSANEVFTALQQGTADAAYNFWMYIGDHKYYEAAPYITAGHLVFDFLTLSMSGNAYDSLSDEDKALFEEAGAYAVETFNNYVAADDASIRKMIEDSGATVVDLTAEQEQAFFDAAKGLYADKLEVYGEDLYKMVGIDVESLK